MTVFWVAVVIMLGLACAGLLPSLWRSAAKNSSLANEDRQLSLFQDRLAELQRDQAQGKLDASQFALARTDLERELLQDTAPAGAPSEIVANPNKGRWLALLLVLFVPALSLTIYGQLGGSLQAPIREPIAAANPEPLPPMAEVATMLAAKLVANPEDGNGWRLLARTYVVLERYSEANQAYARARKLLGDSPDLLVDHAESLALASGDRFVGMPARLLQMALQQQPKHPKALWLSGIAAYQEAQFQLAINVWQSLLQQKGGSKELNDLLRQYIADAQSHLAAPSAPLATATASNPVAQPSATSAASIQVQVRLDPALAAQASPEDTLFIFARAAQGPKMPLAIARLQVRDLPANIELNDEMAMLPNRRLSDFAQIVVGARISKSGQGIGQAGDLEGLSEILSPPLSELITLVIDQVRP